LGYIFKCTFLCYIHDKNIKPYFVADSTLSGVVYLTVWRKFSQRLLKGRFLMLMLSKMREQIRICVLEPIRYFLDVNFRREWMDKCGLSFCQLILLNLYQTRVLSSYGGKNYRTVRQNISQLFC